MLNDIGMTVPKSRERRDVASLRKQRLNSLLLHVHIAQMDALENYAFYCEGICTYLPTHADWS